MFHFLSLLFIVAATPVLSVLNEIIFLPEGADDRITTNASHHSTAYLCPGTFQYWFTGQVEQSDRFIPSQPQLPGELADTADTSAATSKSAIPTKSANSASTEAKRSDTPKWNEAWSQQPICQDELPEELAVRRHRIQQCLKNYYQHPVNADRLRPWSIMHGVLSYGRQSMVTTQGHHINAIDYLCANGRGHDRQLLSLRNGKLSVNQGNGFQGHEGQLLAILAQVNAPIDHSIQWGDNHWTIADLVEYEKSTCFPRTELTFKLIGLSYYLNSDETWQDQRGGHWDIARLIEEELRQPINGAACGGTHRLMGLSFSVAVRQSRGEPIDGAWKRAAQFVNNYHKTALRMINSDGSFSAEFFEGRSSSSDPIKRIYSTGHALEWLAISLDDETLHSAPVSAMVDALLRLMESDFHPQRPLVGTDVGPKGHALRALRLYGLRMFGDTPDFQQVAVNKPLPQSEISKILSTQPRIQLVNPDQNSSISDSAPNRSAIPVRGGRSIRRR